MGGMGGMGGMMGGGMGGMMGGAGAPHAASASAEAGKNPNFTYAVNVTADPATNALVVSASPQDWETLKQIIDQLDVPRVQVFVQAIIVEVSAERSKELGVNFMSSTGISNSVFGVGQLNFGQLQNAIGNPLGLSGLGLGLASGSTCSIPSALASTAVSAVSGTGTSGTATSGNISAPCDVALLLALETDSHSDVLSAPTLLTADNTEAMIVVGQNLPFVGSAAANAGLPGQIFNSVERQNVGITLDMVPQVSQGDYIRLDLYEEVSNVLGNTANNPLGPTTTIRSASTTVVVQNNRTAVIGGLLATQETQNNQGVPFISHIPVLGNLFSDKQSDKQKPARDARYARFADSAALQAELLYRGAAFGGAGRFGRNRATVRAEFFQRRPTHHSAAAAGRGRHAVQHRGDRSQQHEVSAAGRLPRRGVRSVSLFRNAS
jgi:general secretion pathway protein D